VAIALLEQALSVSPRYDSSSLINSVIFFMEWPCYPK